MNTDRSIEEVNLYRKMHRRCRTCTYASDSNSGWFCGAKLKRHPFTDLCDTRIAGCFCKLYVPKEF